MNTRTQGDWQAVGHELETGWLDFAGRYGPWILGGLLLVILARSFVRRRRYRAVDILSDADRGALREAVRAAEARTSGEIVVVVVEGSDGHPEARWKATLFALVLGTLLFAGALPWGRPALFVGAQIALAAAGFAAAHWLLDLRRLFVSEARANEVAEEQALQEFQRLEIGETVQRNAVLVFVSLFEHRVVVLADEGAHTAAGTDAWIDVDEAVLAGIRRGSLRAGLEQGIIAAGEVLARVLPRGDGDGPGELRDDVVVRRK